jgi:hypothetical protein
MMLQTSNTNKNLQTAKTNVTKPATSSYILNTNFFPQEKKKKDLQEKTWKIDVIRTV